MPSSDLPRRLAMAGSILFTETENEERLSIAAQSPSRRVAFSAVGDTCPLCLALDGRVFLADSPEAERFSPPLHINCDCLWVEVGDDEEGAEDWFEPDGELEALAERHGHLMADAEGKIKYEALRIPAAPRGRDFTVRRVKDPVTGELRTEIEWHRPRYELDLPPNPRTGQVPVQTGVTETGPRWRPIERPGEQREPLSMDRGSSRSTSPRPYPRSLPPDGPEPPEAWCREVRERQRRLAELDHEFDDGGDSERARLRPEIEKLEAEIRERQQRALKDAGGRITPPTFDTPAEAADWARDHLVLRASYEGVDAKTANIMNARLAANLEAFPEGVGRARYFGTDPRLRELGDGSQLSPRLQPDLLARVARDAARTEAELRRRGRLHVSGRYLVDASVEGAVDHELAHLIDNLLKPSLRQRLASAVANLSPEERTAFLARLSHYGADSTLASDELRELMAETVVLWWRSPDLVPLPLRRIIEAALRRRS